MSIDPDDSALEEALRSDLPSADAKERVRRRLLAAGVAVGNGMAVTTSAAAGTATTTGVLAKAAGASWGIKLGLAAAITIPSVGLWLEDQSQPHAAVPAPSAPQRVPVAAATPVVEPTPVSAPVVEPAPEAVRPLRAASAAMAATAVTEPAVAEPVVPLPTGPSQAEFAPAVEAPALAVTKPNSTLAEETRLLDGAFAELAAGNRARAAQLIAEHEARFPAGLLQKERGRAKAKLSENFRGE